MDEINLKPDTLIHKHTGKLIMIVGKVDAVPNCDQFLEQIEMTLRYSTYCKIDYEPLIIDKNIRENIIFGLPFDEKKYYEVLEIVNLLERLNQFPEGDQTRMD
jgi:ABC-type transport system involved in cytochrome bd biosynthesis fused ATPase/permease subunit